MREEKVSDVQSSIKNFVKPKCSLALGGMHMHNNPMELVREVVRQGIKIKTLITSPSACINADLLIGANLVEEIVTSYVGFEHLGLAPNFRGAVERGEIKLKECDEPFIVYGLRAGASGIPFIPYPKGVISDLPKINKDYKTVEDPYTKEEVFCAKPLKPDVALIVCQRADSLSNASFAGAKFTDYLMIKASSKVILQVEEILSKDSLWDVPSFLVNAICLVPFGCHPTASHGYYRYDEPHLRHYLKACRSRKGFEEYLESFVYPSYENYLENIGKKRLEELRIRV
ncbi:MAG: CoA transferase subunit A [Candidatus Methanofastidiosia archaeon]